MISESPTLCKNNIVQSQSFCPLIAHYLRLYRTHIPYILRHKMPVYFWAQNVVMMPIFHCTKFLRKSLSRKCLINFWAFYFVETNFSIFNGTLPLSRKYRRSRIFNFQFIDLHTGNTTVRTIEQFLFSPILQRLTHNQNIKFEKGRSYRYRVHDLYYWSFFQELVLFLLSYLIELILIYGTVLFLKLIFHIIF